MSFQSSLFPEAILAASWKDEEAQSRPYIVAFPQWEPFAAQLELCPCTPWLVCALL